MADNSFRSYGSREPAARDEFDPNAPEAVSDPLAELARLIGQSDNYGRQERHGVAHAPAEGADSGLDWAANADDGYAAEPDYSAQPPEPPRADLAPQHGYEEEPPAPPPARFFFGPAAKSNGFREDQALPRAGYAADQQPQPVSPNRSPSFVPAGRDDYGHAGEQAHAGHQDYDQDYSSQDYYDDEAPHPRRGGLIVVIAVLALAVLGTAGAFGYRAMFGGSVLSSLAPPIIRASNGPNKITPTYGDAQGNNGQAGQASSGSPEQLAPPAEQPIDVQPSAKIAPRVISTIPISPGAPAAAAGGQMPVAPGAPAQVAAAPLAPAPMVAAPAAPAPVVAPAPPPAIAAPATTPAGTPEPKRVHTVAIHADQQGTRVAAAAPSAPAAAAHRPNTSASRANEPLSIVPGAAGQTPAPAPAPAPSRSAGAATVIANAAPASPVASGGYAVQVTSQRSEAEAQAAFRALKAKYPNQLGSREPIIHRADLGAKGTYYRALVGPFASAEAAAEMCSSLKAAGGNCLVQRN